MQHYDERLCRMETRFREPPVRAPNTPIFRTYVVMGDTDHAGCVKEVLLLRGQYCPFVETSWTTYQDGSALLTELRIPMEFVKRGWFFLEKAYDVEGNAHGKAQWHDFQKACRQHRAFHAKGDKRIVPGFPDELLPKAVHECLARRDPHLEAWEPDMGSVEIKKRGRSQAETVA